MTWHIANIRDANWYDEGPFGVSGNFQRDERFDEFGFNFAVVWPGQPVAMYHRETHQEGFLVVAGECLLLVEGEERPLRRWDFVHCPGGTNHMIVGAGRGLSVVVAVGARGGRKGLVYPVEPLALEHGVGVERETTKPQEAYAAFPAFTRCRYRPGWLPE